MQYVFHAIQQIRIGTVEILREYSGVFQGERGNERQWNLIAWNCCSTASIGRTDFKQPFKDQVFVYILVDGKVEFISEAYVTP